MPLVCSMIFTHQCFVLSFLTCQVSISLKNTPLNVSKAALLHCEHKQLQHKILPLEMKSCVFLNCGTLVILKGVCLRLYSLTHLLSQANVPTHQRKNMHLRVSYFLLIMHGMYKSKDVIMIDLRRTQQVSEYNVFYSRGS